MNTPYAQLLITHLRRFTKYDFMGYAGADSLPSGAPLIASVVLPKADGSNAPDIEVEVLVSSCFEHFVVGVHGYVDEDGPPIMIHNAQMNPGDSWFLQWDKFNCERDAIAFAELICSGHLSLSALEVLGGKGEGI